VVAGTEQLGRVRGSGEVGTLAVEPQTRSPEDGGGWSDERTYRAQREERAHEEKKRHRRFSSSTTICYIKEGSS
jgi:hypothetical protein